VDAMTLAVDVGQVWADTWRIVGTFLILAAIFAWWHWLLKNFGTY
jgi:hypothetical protein